MTKIHSMKNKHPERQPQKAISSGCSFQRYFSSSLLLVIHKRLVLTPASCHWPGEGADFFRGTVCHRWHPGHAGGKPAASQWLCGSFSRCVYGILCISGNLSGRFCGRFEASFRPRDREEHPKAFRRSPWPR